MKTSCQNRVPDSCRGFGQLVRNFLLRGQLYDLLHQPSKLSGTIRNAVPAQQLSGVMAKRHHRRKRECARVRLGSIGSFAPQPTVPRSNASVLRPWRTQHRNHWPAVWPHVASRGQPGTWLAHHANRNAPPPHGATSWPTGEAHSAARRARPEPFRSRIWRPAHED